MPQPAQRESCSPPAVIQFEMSFNVLVGHNGSHGSYLQTCLPFISTHTHTHTTHQFPEEGKGVEKKRERVRKKKVSGRERAVITVVTVNNSMAAGLKQITCRWFYYVQSQRNCSHSLLLSNLLRSCSLRQSQRHECDIHEHNSFLLISLLIDCMIRSC